VNVLQATREQNVLMSVPRIETFSRRKALVKVVAILKFALKIFSCQVSDATIIENRNQIYKKRKQEDEDDSDNQEYHMQLNDEYRELKTEGVKLDNKYKQLMIEKAQMEKERTQLQKEEIQLNKERIQLEKQKLQLEIQKLEREKKFA
jgi:hypothetical protein